jgi:hypothetical protein
VQGDRDKSKTDELDMFFLASIFFLVALLLLGLERGHGVKRGDFQRLWFNANNGHHHRLPLAGTDE